MAPLILIVEAAIDDMEVMYSMLIPAVKEVVELQKNASIKRAR